MVLGVRALTKKLQLWTSLKAHKKFAGHKDFGAANLYGAQTIACTFTQAGRICNDC